VDLSDQPFKVLSFYFSFFSFITVLYQKRFRRERKIRVRYQQQLSGGAGGGGVGGGNSSIKGNPNANDNSVTCSDAELCTGMTADAKCSSGSSDVIETLKGE